MKLTQAVALLVGTAAWVALARAESPIMQAVHVLVLVPVMFLLPFCAALALPSVWSDARNGNQPDPTAPQHVIGGIERFTNKLISLCLYSALRGCFEHVCGACCCFSTS